MGVIRLFGLGIYPPRTAALDALEGLEACGVVLHRFPRPAMGRWLRRLLPRCRPLTRLADAVALARRGETVGVALWGHAALGGGDAPALAELARRAGVLCETAPSSSHVASALALTGTLLNSDGRRGIQLLDAVEALSDPSLADWREPAVFFDVDRAGFAAVMELLRRMLPTRSRVWRSTADLSGLEPVETRRRPRAAGPGSWLFALPDA